MSTEMSLDEAITYLRPIAESATVGHYAEALGLVLAAAGVTQPEPEYEYGPGYKEANGRWFSLDGAFTVREAAEHSLNNYADDQQVHLLRRVKAGSWEPAPNQEGELS